MMRSGCGPWRQHQLDLGARLRLSSPTCRPAIFRILWIEPNDVVRPGAVGRPDLFGTSIVNVSTLKSWWPAAVAVAAVGVIVWNRWTLLGLFVDVTRPLLCDTTTYRTAIGPDGDYSASVIEVDCGGMSSTNRQVTLRKGLLHKQTIFYFNGTTELDLIWSGRTLMVSGSRPLSSMDRAPPSTVEWEGVVVKYLTPTSN